jgi:hypothetical protein
VIAPPSCSTFPFFKRIVLDVGAGGVMLIEGFPFAASVAANAAAIGPYVMLDV